MSLVNLIQDESWHWHRSRLGVHHLTIVRLTNLPLFFRTFTTMYYISIHFYVLYGFSSIFLLVLASFMAF